MADVGFGIQLTIVALVALCVIALVFIALTRGLERLIGIASRERVKEPEVAVPEEEEKTALIATAAVMAYLEAERLAAVGASRGSSTGQSESTGRIAEDEAEIQDHYQG